MMCCSSFFLFAVFAGKARFEKKLARVVRHFFKFRVLVFLRTNIRNSNGKLWREAKNEYGNVSRKRIATTKNK